jgi:hypothetical protein
MRLSLCALAFSLVATTAANAASINCSLEAPVCSAVQNVAGGPVVQNGIDLFSVFGGKATSLTFDVKSGAGTFGEYIGLYSDTPTGPDMVNLFTPSAGPDTSALVTFTGPNSGTIFGPGGVNTGNFSGINPNSFGLFVAIPNPTTHSVTLLFSNPQDNKGGVNYFGNFQPTSCPNGACDDFPTFSWTTANNGSVAPITSADCNPFNFDILSIQSATADAPEPASVLLFGSGLGGLALLGGRVRRKLKSA